MVEWKKIGEVLTVHTGKQLNRSGLSEVGKYPVINGGRTPSGYTDSYNENKNSITISQGGESAGFVNWVDTAFWAGAHCYVVENTTNQNLRFLFHLLKNYEYGIMESKQGAGIPGLNRKNLYSILIPIPSIEEQNRIVGILDTFTDSIENLKQQIAQRRKQYEHYRDQLLDLEGKEGVEMKMLGDFAFTKVGPFGSLIHKEDYICGGVPLVNPVHMINGKVMKDDSFTISEEQASILNNYKLKINDVLFARRGEIGRCAIITEKEENYICGTGSLIVRFKDNLNSKYMLYIFSSPYCKRYLEKSAIGGTMLNINCGIVEKMIVPIPSLEEQSRIVSILDTFEASISNLEAQLEQRQKQYEYYRNQLLTFE